MEMRYVAPCGMVGTGFQESSFKRVLAAEPAFVGCDGGTTDDGPYQLGAGKPMFSRAACKRDLKIMLAGTRAAGIPLLHTALAGDGRFGLVRWDERFIPDAEDHAGQATCEGGEHLPFVGLLAAALARAVQDFLRDGRRGDSMVSLSGVSVV